MKLKRKLISCICMFAVALTSLVVGVWALKTVDFTVGGNLSYVAPGIEATISKGTLANGTFVNSADASTKMPQTQITKTDTASTLSTKFAKWQNLSLAFNEAGDDTTITFSITNDMSSKYLVIDISTAYNSADNATISINTSSVVLDPYTSQEFVITLAVTDKTVDASLYGFSVVFNMTMADSNPVVDLQYDSTNDYYYVEMGTYNSSAVRWKLVGVNGEHFDTSTQPTSGIGTFILETTACSAITQAFDANYSTNNYSGAPIRDYLATTYAETLSLANDTTYQSIVARTIQNLHADIGWYNGGVGGDDPLYYPQTGVAEYQTYTTTLEDSTGSDKLWLMSVKELYTYIGGGTYGSDKTIPSAWDSSIKTNLAWNSTTYWSRSPYSGASSGAIYINADGNYIYGSINLADSYAIRPAFNVRFKYATPIELEYDAEEGYYYVEMGTYNSSAVRWRLVGVDGEHFDASTTMPTAGQGTFILETHVTEYKEFNASYSDGNDYATSDIRQYLKSDYLLDLNLAGSSIYNSIVSRSMKSLYTDMAWRIDENYQVEDCTLPSGETGADKLWLMSVAEIYTLVGGGTITNNTIDDDWSSYYDDLIWHGDVYWLRSPYPDYSSDAFYVYDIGDWDGSSVANTDAVRPAFNAKFVNPNESPARELIQEDEEGFYVEMGTYNDAPVKWRMIGLNGEKFTGETLPAVGTVTFVLETFVEEYSEFGSSLDYANSYARTYLMNGFLNNLEIDIETDSVYKEIVGRSMAHLYSNIGWNFVGNDAYESNSVYSLETDNTDIDKLWLMSAVEVYTMLGGGTLDGDILSDDWTEIAPNLMWYEENYWLRSPNPDDKYTQLAIVGDYWDYIDKSATAKLRPAFNLVLADTNDIVVNEQEVSYLTFEYYNDMTAHVTACDDSFLTTSVHIPSRVLHDGEIYNVVAIEPGAFAEHKYISVVTIGSRVQDIGEDAFYSCVGLSSVTILNSVLEREVASLSIGVSAFSECINLTSVTIPEYTYMIERNAFAYCTNLREVNVKAIEPPELNQNAFTDCSEDLVIYVPMESVEVYKSANEWSSYADYIQGKDF